MKAEINNLLTEIERQQQVRIIYACESGSRAWGFASPDSDYDVRFIYVRERDWYLSLDEGVDTIQLPLQGVIDPAGWDLRKTLRLLRKSNAPLLEWLNSPIVYRRSDLLPELAALAPRCCNPIACFHHYLGMARTAAKNIDPGQPATVKKCFYALRPMLACRWIEAGLGPVPVEFSKLLEEVCPDHDLYSAIASLLQEKAAALEQQHTVLDRLIFDYLQAELHRLPAVVLPRRESEPLNDQLSGLLRKAVNSEPGKAVNSEPGSQ